MFALGGVAKDIITYPIHFETILLRSCDFFLRKKKLLSTVISMGQL